MSGTANSDSTAVASTSDSSSTSSSSAEEVVAVPPRPVFPTMRRTSLPTALQDSLPRHPSLVSLDTDPFLPDMSPPPSRPASTSLYVSSPLNPTARAPALPRRATFDFNRIASDEVRALSSPDPENGLPRRESMILYRFVDPAGVQRPESVYAGLDMPPSPPFVQGHKRVSTASSIDSLMSISADSKYPLVGGNVHSPGVVAYSFDPLADDGDGTEDWLFDEKGLKKKSKRAPRRWWNVAMLFLVVLGLLCILMIYPIVKFSNDKHNKHASEVHNPYINSTGQAEERPVDVDGNFNARRGVSERIQLKPASSAFGKFQPIDSVYLDPERVLLFEDTFDRTTAHDSDEALSRNEDDFWHLLPNAPQDSPHILQDGRLVLQLSGDVSRPALSLRTPLCLSHGYIEVAYSIEGHPSSMWMRYDSDEGVWLKMTINNISVKNLEDVCAYWIDAIRVWRTASDPSILCTSESITQDFDFTPLLN
ncbi:hypothetical protein CYLTODRAFT_422329 [Cylindrobasidium torrendii FP15055 ss-10]|uniref:Uncharacterized protein n=1 Tax=Cylindrobasidium torrendii FP15055 ss-10 TaxID=1314674 RepID=A0A0D7BAZ0_9AGAR|nr:hypothetical protein CYLTODRAFT_422329 [Cylindrobasidium torrendii FP15055 ss-10]